MAAGKALHGIRHSPIVQAIMEAEDSTNGTIHVRLTRRWLERDPMRTASRLFRHLGLGRPPHVNAVLIYVNLRSRKFAVLGDEAVHRAAGQMYWNDLARELRHALLSTHPERAIAGAVRHAGEMLRKHFPQRED